jgi:hypothetical protein
MPDAQTATSDAQDRWAHEREELPPRPRRRLLKVDQRTALKLALLGVLLLACGFIGGVLVEKGQTAAPAPGAAPGGGFQTGFAGRSRGAGGGGAVIGEVSYIQGHTLYVSDPEGNTLKITTSPASSITKTVTTDVHGIHPGDTVVVRGPRGTGGTLSAESVSVSTRTGGFGGAGLGSLFGGNPRSGG